MTSEPHPPEGQPPVADPTPIKTMAISKSKYTNKGTPLGPNVKDASIILKRGMTIVILDLGKHQSLVVMTPMTWMVIYKIQFSVWHYAYVKALT